MNKIEPIEITTAKAAEIAGVETRTIRRWVDAGLIDGRLVAPRLILVNLASLYNYLRVINKKERDQSSN